MDTTSSILDKSAGVLRQWKEALTRLCARHGLHRSRRHHMVSGVCGGLAERFDVPVSLVRFVFVLVALPGFVHALLLYIALAYLMPKSDELSPHTS